MATGGCAVLPEVVCRRDGEFNRRKSTTTAAGSATQHQPDGGRRGHEEKRDW
jgi:hypothetical protein